MNPVTGAHRVRHARCIFVWVLFLTVAMGCASKPPAVERSGRAATHRAMPAKEKANWADTGGRTQPPAPDNRRTYRHLKFEPLVAGKEIKLRIKAQGVPADFPEGGSYFVAVELPSRSTAYALDVTSRLVGSRRIEETHVFYPTLLFLDENFREVATIDPVLKPVYVRKYGDVFTARLTRLPEARYLVFYTDKSHLQERLFMRITEPFRPASARTVAPGVNVSPDGLHYTNRGATGQLHIRLELME